MSNHFTSRGRISVYDDGSVGVETEATAPAAPQTPAERFALLADLFTTHPDLPISWDGGLVVEYLHGLARPAALAELRRVGRLLGVEPGWLGRPVTDTSSHAEVEHPSGVYRLIYIDREMFEQQRAARTTESEDGAR